MKKLLCLSLAALLALGQTAFAAQNLNDLSLDELRALISDAENVIAQRYIVPEDVALKLHDKTQEAVASRVSGGEVRWPELDWTYAREQGGLIVGTKVQLVKDGQTEDYDVRAIYVEKENDFELAFLKVGENIVLGQWPMEAPALMP